jgi:hypothetical protein
MDIEQELNIAIAMAITAKVEGTDQANARLLSHLNQLRIAIPKEILKQVEALTIAGMIAGLDQKQAALKNACKKSYTRDDYTKEHKC